MPLRSHRKPSRLAPLLRPDPRVGGIPWRGRYPHARRLPYTMRFFVGATQVASLLRRSGDNAATERPETLAARAAPTARSTGGWHSLAWSVSACATTPLYDAVFCRSDASRELFAAIGWRCRYGATGNPRGLRRSYGQIHGWVAFLGVVGIRMRDGSPIRCGSL